MMPKRRKPTHPGKILWEEFLKPLSMTPARFAQELGQDWNEKRVQALINGEEDFYPRLAETCAGLFKTTPEFWMRLQDRCHQWATIQKENEKGKTWKKAQ